MHASPPQTAHTKTSRGARTDARCRMATNAVMQVRRAFPAPKFVVTSKNMRGETMVTVECYINKKTGNFMPCQLDDQCVRSSVGAMFDWYVDDACVSRQVEIMRNAVRNGLKEVPASVASFEYETSGYTVIPNALSIVHETLEGPDATEHRSKRARSGTQEWQGARRTLLAFQKQGFGVGVTPRGRGRLDYRLPEHLWPTILADLQPTIEFVRRLRPNAKLRTVNVMLSSPGSDDQPMHVDGGSSAQYVTVLIPLTVQNESTGGTEIVPGSHRDAGGEAILMTGQVRPGDALIFDGATTHRGTGNRSDTDRIFLYLAFSSRRDENVL